MTCPDLAGTSERVVDLEVANRWGPSRLPPAVQWTRDSRSQSPRDASTKIEVLQRGTFALAGPLFVKTRHPVEACPNHGAKAPTEGSSRRTRPPNSGGRCLCG
eukprot:CAMPEP_0171745230 /NCGR_PEP_ID=MMETSP0991-20121206/38024_1 /TAXON_ID=483369 /ORGANISM="non described non described, Strain CCMP2098" /LENGTH=102 /DNA_ID=CAMNT_0012344637 /DNA_START=17 /DNA_END=325 /DNA_ORIENTATION=-